MICVFCGKIVDDDSKYCPKCGNKIIKGINYNVIENKKTSQEVEPNYNSLDYEKYNLEDKHYDEDALQNQIVYTEDDFYNDDKDNYGNEDNGIDDFDINRFFINEATNNKVSDNKIGNNEMSDNKVSDNELPKNDISNNELITNKSKKKKYSLIISLVAGVLCLSLIVGIIFFANKKDKDSDNNSSNTNVVTVKTMADYYSEAGCRAPWASYGTDYIILDSNPYDYDSDSNLSTLYIYSVSEAIQKLNSIFELPSYLYQDMLETRAMDGRQNYDGEKYNVSWTYHPDQGLSVRYGKK